MNDDVSSARVALKWGLITGIALIVYSTLLNSLGQMSNGWLSVMVYVIIVVGLVLGMRDFRRQNGDYLTFGQGVGLGALLSAVAGMISSTYNVLYNTFIDPGLQERVMNNMREQLEDQGNLSDDQIDQAMEISKMFQSPGLQFVSGIFGAILVGVFLSLIVAAVLRQHKENPFE